MTTATRQFVQRYAVVRVPGSTRWGVYDRQLKGFCALPATDAKVPAMVALEWPERQGAETWLYLCRVTWGAGLIEAPDGWNPC